MRLFGPAPLPLDERRAVDLALTDAFAPLRASTANLSPARVRAVIRWSAPEPRALRGLALLTRISEVSVAAVIAAFICAGSFASFGVVPAVPYVTRDAATSATRVLNGRVAFQPPIDPHPSDYRTVAGGAAANAAIARRADAEPVVPPVRDSEPFAPRP